MNKFLTVFGRLFYWALWLAIWIVIRITRRARVLVVCQDEFLVVRSFIGSGSWTLPGGGVSRGESYRVGVVRELFEEVGISLDPDNVIECEGSTKYARLFGAYLDEKPDLSLLRYEIKDYKWIKIDERADCRLSTYIENAVLWWQETAGRDIIGGDDRV
ncbi:NUDIX hydrolase [Candidatus Saccharibacteria bacterium]|jgi:8-oxo-dGTP pyrophosphatase MutT (NUDIX family)|nr:NUDIX hydrolase [Candidatus Saccharibacteria bacterium]